MMTAFQIVLFLYILLALVGITEGFLPHFPSTHAIKTPSSQLNKALHSLHPTTRSLHRIQSSTTSSLYSFNPTSFQSSHSNKPNEHNVAEIIPNKPLLTSAINSYIGFACADILSQLLFSGRSFSLFRLLRTSSYGFCIHGPLGNLFYRRLNRDIPTTDESSLAKKIFAEQVLWGSVFVSTFILFSAILRGISPHGAFSLLRRHFFPMTINFWLIWPVTHLFNYHVLKDRPSTRLLVMHSVQLAINVIFCTIANRWH